MSRRTRKHGGKPGKPGSSSRKAARNQLRQTYLQAANIRRIIAMMSGKKFGVNPAVRGKKGHNPFMLESLMPKTTTMKSVRMALPAVRATTRKSGKPDSFSTSHEEELQRALRQSVKLQEELKKARKAHNHGKVAELEAALAAFGL